jgi:autotransporter-associated beta strand protein
LGSAQPVSIDTLQFGSGAPAYSIFLNPFHSAVEVNGAGIINNSASIPTISIAVSQLDFNNASSAANATITTFLGGTLHFNDSSTAGTATISNISQLAFFGTSTAGNATITNNAPGTVVEFFNASTAGSATITINSALYFNDSSAAGNATISNNGALSFAGLSSAGAAQLTNNSGKNIFFQNNSTAGQATINNSGILAFSDSSSGGTAQITNSASLTFNGTSSAGGAQINNNNSFAALNFNDTSSAGSATITNNGGFVAFNGASNAATTSVVNNGALSFNNTSSAGSAAITNNSTTSSTQFANSASAGQATIVNLGNLSFLNTSSAGSASITSGNVLNFRDSSTADNARITNGQQLNFLNLSTAGNASITNGDQLNFLNSSTAGNAVVTNNGRLSFFNGSTAGDAVITNTSTGLLVFSGTSTGGAARLINNAGGIMDFSPSTGANNDGRITAGSIEGAGTFYLGARQLWVGGNNLSTTVSGLIADCTGGGLICQGAAAGGSLVKAGTGTLTLTGSNTYTGGTAVNGGTLQLSGAGTLGATTGTTTVNSGGTLDLGGTTQTQAALNLAGGTLQNGSLNAPISSAGGTINGIGGTASLAATSGTTVINGTNTYTGGTTVTNATLTVNGSLSDPTIGVGGILNGTGSVGDTTIQSGGTLAPGSTSNPTGTLTITGNLAFQSGAVYLVQVVPAGAASTAVAGTATLNGATANAVFGNGNYWINKTSTILTASGGVSGTFGTLVNTNLPANFTSRLSYDANNVYLNLSLNYTPGPGPGSAPPNIGGGLSGNQQGVGNALSNSFNSNGGIPMVYAMLSAAGLTQASGELGTGSQQTTFDAMGLFMGLLTDPFMQRNGVPPSASSAAGFAEEESASAYAARKGTDAFAMFTKAPPRSFEQRWRVWAAGFGGSRSTDGNAVVGSNDTTSRIAGTAVGADYLFSPNTLAGFALAGGGTNFSVSGLGSGRSDLFQAGAYVRHVEGPAYVAAALAYGWQDITTDRDVIIAGVDHLRAEFNANAYSGRLEGGYRFVAPWTGGVGLTPYAAAQFTTFDLPAYAEQVISGTSAFALSYAAKSVTDTRTEFGLRSDKSFALRDSILTLRGRLAWAHDFNPDHSIAATFQALPGASFVVNGAAQAPDSALTTASAEIRWFNGWSAAATFEGEFSNVTRSYAGKGVLQYSW